jgi:acyl-CoA reductase-like NAD-dependent aldehyde dehydrogenase/nicotinamidase-related amidase
MNAGARDVLLLIDLQEDFLSAPGLEPHRERVVVAARACLEAFRAAGRPVIHVRTTVVGDAMMAHWRGRPPRCVPGTPGHGSPLTPEAGEAVVDKIFFSGFSVAALARALPTAVATRLVLAGVHLHACVRATALDALALGYEVVVAADATGSDDPVHAAASRRWLEERGVRFFSSFATSEQVAPLELEWHHAPAEPERRLFAVTASSAEELGRTVAAARSAAMEWRLEQVEKDALRAEGFAELVERDAASLAALIREDVGKPIRQARGEAARCSALGKAAARQARATIWAGRGEVGGHWRRLPLGVVLALTPWNNPAAIPAGKILPALALGNAVVWKPAPAGHRVAEWLRERLVEAGFPPERTGLIHGGPETARLAMAASVDGVTVSGSLATGFGVTEAAARHGLALQAELGGNNAAVVLGDADMVHAAHEIAAGAFRFAGQRCTANRRVVVVAAAKDVFLRELVNATVRFEPGDPSDPATELGPMLGERAAREFDARVAAGLRDAGVTELMIPWRGAGRGGAYRRPRILLATDAGGALVQEESFGPLLVVQTADHEEHALCLCNGVRQGLAAALFSRSRGAWERFRNRAEVGLIKWNQSTADAAVDLPFGGWKRSGLGPPEHGVGNPCFYTRYQAIYGDE